MTKENKKFLTLENLVVLDCEVYPNYTLFAFKSLDHGTIVTLDIRGEDNCLSHEKLKLLHKIMVSKTTFGYNSRNYDIPVILYALQGKTAREICNLSNYIIDNNSPRWKTMDKFNLMSNNSIDHFDIQEPSPAVRISLKLYGARLHSKKLQDLPIKPNTMLSKKEMDNIDLYCINDLNTTIDLYNSIKNVIDLRLNMGKRYGSDLRSKSDAQIAEVVIKSQLSATGSFSKAPKIPEGKVFKYDKPKYITFESDILKDLLKTVEEQRFLLDANGKLKLPEDLTKFKIVIGSLQYKLGIGGLHSKETSQAIVAKDDEYLIDKDVTSYYPSIILNEKLYPKHLGEPFLDVYKKIVEERVEAKVSKNTVVNESLKIVINGSYGKLGSKYSFLYSPNLLLNVTLTGQLALLMLIEKLESCGFRVVSANTDGVVAIVNKDKYKQYSDICNQWENCTKFNLEESRYTAMYSRDVNNYLAIKTNGFKTKGAFKIGDIRGNPDADISVEAVREFLINKKPIIKTISECKDVRKFIFARTVNGGATYKGEYLGRVVRWIYSTNGDKILVNKPHVTTGKFSKVPKSDGSRPLMDLPGELPEDLDISSYVKESVKLLDSCGYFEKL